jgi:alkaline phosphatase
MVSKPLADKANLNYAHQGHSGVDINVYAAGALSETFHGNFENTFICQTLTNFLGLNLTQEVTKK